MKKISILVPAYNEEASLPLLYPELAKLMDDDLLKEKYEWELLFVNDGSRDRTLVELKKLRESDPRVSYIDLSRNFGKENAMLAGFDYVTGDCMVIMDADLQHPPHVIKEMLEKWEEGYDDVYAKRLIRGKESWIRKQLSMLFYKLLSRTTRVEMLGNVGDFRLLDRRCIEALKQLREAERYTKGLYCWIGYRKTYVEFEQGDRLAGESSWGMLGLFKLAVQGIISFSSFPLRIATVLGGVISLVAFIYALFIIIKTMLYGDPVAGFPTLMCVILFLGGIQLICIGIIGEYLAKMFSEIKNRPVYLVREHNGELL